MKTMNKKIGWICALIVAGASVAQANLINVNFTGGPKSMGASDPAPLGTTGMTWNEWMGYANDRTNLVDSGGTTTTVAFSASPYSGQATYNIPTAQQILKGWSYTTGTNDTTITLSGLVANGEYRIAIVSMGDDAAGQGGDFDIGGTIKTSLGTNNTALVEGNNFVTFDSVFADASGNLVITASALSTDTSNTLAINGFQIESIPEPATLGLVISSAIGILFIRRKFMM